MVFLKIDLYREDNIGIVTCEGNLQRMHETLMSRHMDTLFIEGCDAVLFDWAEVSYFDSMGLEGLITIHKGLTGKQLGAIAVLITDPVLVDVYRKLGFTKLIPLYTDKQEAVKSLQEQFAHAET